MQNHAEDRKEMFVFDHLYNQCKTKLSEQNFGEILQSIEIEFIFTNVRTGRKGINGQKDVTLNYNIL